MKKVFLLLCLSSPLFAGVQVQQGDVITSSGIFLTTDGIHYPNGSVQTSAAVGGASSLAVAGFGIIQTSPTVAIDFVGNGVTVTQNVSTATVTINSGIAGVTAGNGLSGGGTSGTVTLNVAGVSLSTQTTGVLPIANGGTGQNSPSLIAGQNIGITGSWPNQTVGFSGLLPSTSIASGSLGASVIASSLSATSGGITAGNNVTTSGTWPFITVNATSGGSGGGLTYSSFTAVNPITYNNTTGVFSLSQVSLSSSVTGNLPASQIAPGSLGNSVIASSIAVGAIPLTGPQISGILPVANGGTGTASPGLIAGSNILSITGTWPNQTINATTQSGSSGGSSSLGIFNGSVLISSPTGGITFDSNTITALLQGATTAAITLNRSSVTLQGNFYNLAALAASTGTLTTSVASLGLSTGTLAAQINTKINFSSITATQPAFWNAGTGVISVSGVSLSSGVSGSLPAASIASGSLGSSVIASSLSATSGGITAGTNVTTSGTWPFITVNASNSGSGGVSVYPATGTASFPIGASFSTMTVTSTATLGAINLSGAGAGQLAITQGADNSVTPAALTSTLWASTNAGTLEWTDGVGVSTYAVAGTSMTIAANHSLLATGTIGKFVDGGLSSRFGTANFPYGFTSTTGTFFTTSQSSESLVVKSTNGVDAVNVDNNASPTKVSDYAISISSDILGGSTNYFMDYLGDSVQLGSATANGGYCFKDGTCQNTAAVGGVSSLGVNFNGVSVTTPTAQINFTGSGVSVVANGSTATVTITAGSGSGGGAAVSPSTQTFVLTGGGAIVSTFTITGSSWIVNGSTFDVVDSTMATGKLFFTDNNNLTNNLNSIITNPVTYYVCAKASGGTCVYNGDGGTVATPGDSNSCLTKDFPCATIQGAVNKFSLYRLGAIVTVQLADTAGTGTDCYAPQNVSINNPVIGGSPINSIQVPSSNIPDTFPPAYVYIVGNTTAPANVMVNGLGLSVSCSTRNASGYDAFSFDNTTGRVNGMTLQSYEVPARSFGSRAFASGAIDFHRSVGYVENVRCVGSEDINSGNGGICIQSWDQSFVKTGSTQTVTNMGWINASNGASIWTTDPTNSATQNTILNYTQNAAAPRVSALSALYHSTIGFDHIQATYNGSGAYTAEQANSGSIIFYVEGYNPQDCPSSLCDIKILNAANLTYEAALEGSFIDDSCVTSGASKCTYTTTPLRRFDSSVMSTVRDDGGMAAGTGTDILNEGATITHWLLTGGSQFANTAPTEFDSDGVFVPLTSKGLGSFDIFEGKNAAGVVIDSITAGGTLVSSLGMKTSTMTVTSLGTLTNVCTDSSSGLTTTSCNNGTVTVGGSVASGNLMKSTGGVGISTAAAIDVINAFSACSGVQYLGADGACHNASGSGTVTVTGTVAAGNLTKFTAGTIISTASASDIVGAFSGCSGIQYLGADGGCHTASSGVGVSSGILNVGTTGQNAIYVASTTIGGDPNSYITTSSTTIQLFSASTQTVTNQLIIPSKQNYLPATNGEIGYDSAQGAYTSFGGAEQSTGTFERVIYSTYSFTDSLTASITGVTESTFTLSYTFPPNSIIKNKVYRVTYTYTETTSGTPATQRAKIKLGGITMEDTGSGTTPGVSLANRQFIAQFFITGTTAPSGASGVDVTGSQIVNSNTTGFTGMNQGAQPASLATNGSLPLQMTMTYGASTAGNVILMKNMIVEELQ